MGHGLPDWYRGVDIAYQALSQMIVRPKYGGALYSLVSGALPANAETTLISISGKGVHYGIYFWATAAAMPDNDYLKAIIDGETLTLPTFKNFIDYNFCEIPGTEARGTVYDEVNKIIAGLGGYGKTFESSYVMKYVETYGQNPTATLYFYYALVTS